MKVFRWGDSLAVVLPKKLVEEMALVEGDELEIIKVEGRTFYVQKANRRAEALKRMEGRALAAPSVYKFDRDDANER